jgi:hypothetical protein
MSKFQKKKFKPKNKTKAEYKISGGKKKEENRGYSRCFVARH